MLRPEILVWALYCQKVGLEMKKAKLFMLEYDGSLGPQITETISIGDIEFNEPEIKSLCACAFPESATRTSSSSPSIFAFSVGDNICYCLFITTREETAPRGHRQISYVIATRSRRFPAFFRLLHSVLSITSHQPKDVLTIMADFIKKWTTHINAGDILELPMLDGTFLIASTKTSDTLLSFTTNYAVPHSSSPYFVNDFWLGCDIVSVLGLAKLKEADRLGDVLYIWESVFLGEPLLVYGATPSAASLAVFTIASMVYPAKLDAKIVPFISVVDPRFGELAANPAGIVGVSNPIALQLADRYSSVLRVGFDDEVGLNKPKRPWAALAGVPLTNSEVRNLLFRNTNALIDALRETLAGGLKSATKIQIASSTLERKIVESRIAMISPAKYFAAQLIKSPFFKSFVKSLIPH